MKTVQKSNNKSVRINYANIEKHDACFSREVAKYSMPIASREFILQYLQEIGSPVGITDMLKDFGLKDDEDRAEAFRWRLSAMIRDGQLVYNRNRKYAIASLLDLIKGSVGLKRDGSGFVIADDGGKDIMLTTRDMRTLLPEDQALVRIVDEDKRYRYGRLVEILQRTLTKVAGQYIEESGVGLVVPTSKYINSEIIIPPEKKGKAKIGQLVVARIVEYPTKICGPIGEIIEILGDQRGGNVEIELAQNTYGLSTSWSQEVLQEVQILKKEKASIPKNEYVGRKNLQELPFVTIDGEDAKDFDDAVYCKKATRGGGWVLYVAIADVSFYVAANSALDKEAFRRGNSVYFPSQVVPMLPEFLSCDICSLKPDVERLAMVCEIHVAASGEITRYFFYEAIIRSHARLTYTLAHAMLEGKDGSFSHLLPHLIELRHLYEVLLKHRTLRGALDFHRVETKIIFDNKNRIKKIVPLMQNYVNEIIEECMLAANVCASKFLLKHKIPALYRVHEAPSEEKMQNLRKLLGNMGLSLGGGKNPTSRDFVKLMHAVVGRKDELLIQTLVMRSLSKAIYAAENIGHFALAYSAYVHFTSPIRRYPDLINHRAIRHILLGNDIAKFFYDQHGMQLIGTQCSATERRADEATEDVIEWMKCEFMSKKVGEIYEGVIVHVTEFGLFIELREVYVEGLLHVTALAGDYYKFDNQMLSLQGKRTRKTYRLGDKIKVKVARVDLDERKIDFALAK